MTFKVIDTKTGKEPTSKVIRNIAKKGLLTEWDIDQFFVGEDGTLVLADSYERIAHISQDRFEVVYDASLIKTENMDNMDKIVKSFIWLLRRFKKELQEDFKNTIKDQNDEFTQMNLIVNSIYDEMNKEMPGYWFDYGFGGDVE